MQSITRSLKAGAVPPQLIGIIDDARRVGIDTFTLEYCRSVVMASISSLNYATEIDFELKSGEEMFRFLIAGAPSGTDKHWSIQFSYSFFTYSLIIRRAGSNANSRLHVRWAIVVENDGAQL